MMTRISEIREKVVSPAASFPLSAGRGGESIVPAGKRRRTMEAAVLVEPGKIRVKRMGLPRPGPGEALVRLQGCGVCASNLPPWQGRPWFAYPMEPGALGHEGWGAIESLGSPSLDFQPGDRVALLSYHAYAGHDVAPLDRLVKLTGISWQRPFPGEPLACALNIFRRSGITVGRTVAVVGVGFLGALLVQMASRAGARVIAVARRPYSRHVAREMGAAEAVAMEDHRKVLAEVKELTRGEFCDIVIEAVGRQWPLDLAAELTRERGRLVIAGYHQDGPRQVNMQMWNWRGFDVVNAHEREDAVYVAGMRQAVAAVASGRLDPYPLLTHAFPLERLGEALDMTRDRPEGFLKAWINLG